MKKRKRKTIIQQINIKGDDVIMKYINTIEDINEFVELYEQIENKLTEIAAAIQFLKPHLYFSTFDFLPNSQEIEIVGQYRQDNDKAYITIPYSYLIDDNYLSDWQQKQEEKRKKEELQKELALKAQEEKEKMEYERLKAKYELEYERLKAKYEG